MEKEINVDGIKIKVGDIEKFLLSVKVGKPDRIRLFINGEKILINSIKDLASIKMADNKKINRMNVDFCIKATKRSVLLKLCCDPEGDLYFEYQNKKTQIQVRECIPTMCIRSKQSIKIDATDLKKYLLAYEVTESDINNIYVKTTVNWEENHPQKLENFLVAKSSDQEDIDYFKLSFVKIQANLPRGQLSNLTLILRKDDSDFYFENRERKWKTSVGFTIGMDNEDSIYLGSLEELINRYDIENTGFFREINKFFDGNIRITFRIKYENTNDLIEYRSEKKYKKDDKLLCNILPKDAKGRIEQFEVFVSSDNCKNDPIKIKGKRIFDNTSFYFKITDDHEKFICFVYAMKDKWTSPEDFKAYLAEKYKSIQFGHMSNLIYKIVNLKEDFVDWSDARCTFDIISFVKDAESSEWMKNDKISWHLNGDFIFYLHPECESIKLGGIKIFIRVQNYKNISSQKGIELENIKMSDLLKCGFFEMNLIENDNRNGANFKLVDNNGDFVCYGDKESEKVCAINDNNKNFNRNDEFIQKFDMLPDSCTHIFAGAAKGYCCDNYSNWRHSSCIFLGRQTKLTFAKELFDKHKNHDLKNSIAICAAFYVLLESQALNDILDIFFETGYLPFMTLVFMDENTTDKLNFNENVINNLGVKNVVAFNISNFTFNESIKNKFDYKLKKDTLNKIKNRLDYAKEFCNVLRDLSKPESVFDFDLFTSEDFFSSDVKKINISEQHAGHSIFIFNPKAEINFDQSFVKSNNSDTIKIYVPEDFQTLENIREYVPDDKIYLMMDGRFEYCDHDIGAAIYRCMFDIIEGEYTIRLDQYERDFIPAIQNLYTIFDKSEIRMLFRCKRDILPRTGQKEHGKNNEI